MARSEQKANGTIGPLQQARPEGLLGRLSENALRHQRTVFRGKLFLLVEQIKEIKPSDNAELAIKRILTSAVIPSLSPEDRVIFAQLMLEVNQKVMATVLDDSTDED